MPIRKSKSVFKPIRGRSKTKPTTVRSQTTDKFSREGFKKIRKQGGGIAYNNYLNNMSKRNKSAALSAEQWARAGKPKG